MDLLEAVARHAADRPGQIAHRWRDEAMTYGELAARSDALAAFLVRRLDDDRSPVVVHGHKQSAMLVSFLACVKAGHPYIPVDSSSPQHRTLDIIDASGAAAVLAIDDLAVPEGVRRANLDEIESAWEADGEPAPRRPIGSDEPFYIIYTSGSTGIPKGVQISRAALNNFASWALSLRLLPGVACGDAERAIYLDHAVFSFDLSVFGIAMALASGATMLSIDKTLAASFDDLFRALRESALTVWISTPSFADLCLGDDGFREALLPRLELFIFCGETLNHATARKLRERFPRAAVLNTYGPTESTVAVTSVVCDDEILAKYRVLPVGVVKPGSRILIWNDSGDEPAGSRGEIVIAGDTVSLGYYRRPDLTDRSFLLLDGPDGPERAYRTGDAGRIEDGMLHFLGRLDFQVKLHGYRIEIEDVEANLRLLPDIQQAVVTAVERTDAPGTVKHLQATVQLRGPLPDNPLRTTVRLKRELRLLLPEYMVPKVFSYVTEIPLTPNGKVDRSKLTAAR